MDLPILFLKTVAMRPYVFAFVAIAIWCAHRLMGWRRADQFFFITWLTALLCELSSTRTGFPFGLYHYTMSTKGQEAYVFDVPFMDSLSFTFLLYGSYCLALAFLLPVRTSPSSEPGAGGTLIRLSFERSVRTSWPVLVLATTFYAYLDMVIDPLALRGDRWFLGTVYHYDHGGLHFGVPLTNYAGWAVVGVVSLAVYFALDRRQADSPGASHSERAVTGNVLLGCALYYSVLAFNLVVTFWIGEPLMGAIGVFMYIPITVLLMLRLIGRLPIPNKAGEKTAQGPS